MKVVDLFAGPGGWDVAARELGLEVLGIELNAQACATREANGLPTLQANVAELDPSEFAPCSGLIASPPCQDFSRAGSRVGRSGARGALVDEVARWALELMPEWVACEQVREVAPIWEEVAEVLEGAGYHTATAVVDAVSYGVPQHRERAILVAHRARPVAIPSPSHVEDPAPPLFGEQLARWRTIADALPARDGWELHPIRGKGITERHGPRPGRPSHRPAPTIRAHKDHRSFWLHPGTGVREPVAAAEGAALQGFPPSFKLVGSATAQGRQVGNAVPPPLAAAILASLVDGPR